MITFLSIFGGIVIYLTLGCFLLGLCLMSYAVEENDTKGQLWLILLWPIFIVTMIILITIYGFLSFIESLF